MATKLNVANLQRDVRQLHKSPVESDEEDLVSSYIVKSFTSIFHFYINLLKLYFQEALRAAALASMTRPRQVCRRILCQMFGILMMLTLFVI
jgi:hypothetical protein